jgi:hypothetical protein
MYNNGVAGSYTIHTSYIQSVGVIYEFNHYGLNRAGSIGNAIKDRSVGTVIRFNRIDDGAHAIDLVEAQDYENVAMPDPRYHATFVYGNQILHNGDNGTAIHYGGDHPGSEASYRKGTLYFFNNTVSMTGTGASYMFQLSTTDEHAEVWNNIFLYSDTNQFDCMRASQDVASGYTTGGILNLGRNWINDGWMDADPYHPTPGQLNGSNNMITGNTSPLDNNLVPLANSAVLDNAQSGPSAASSYVVNYQLTPVTFIAAPRIVVGAGMDLGAIEKQ